MLKGNHKNWFKDWFDSPYYHILYKDRNYSEAELLIDNLIAFLNPKKKSRFLDLACGKGRHSVYLNKKGFDVSGIDLSECSIDYAKHYENEHLHFYVHDMRKVVRINYFDCVLNLFTSFGYFENERDDLSTINAVCKALKPNGIFVLDFMNSKKIISCMPYEETKKVDGVEFRITKTIENKFIIKQIKFSDKGMDFHFEERVKILTLADFENYFAVNKLKILHLRGNYQLENFNENTSDRLIIIAQK